MGIKFRCPNGHKLNVKSFLAGKRGVCPDCQATFRIPAEPGGSDVLAMALPSLKGANGAAAAEAPAEPAAAVATATPAAALAIAPTPGTAAPQAAAPVVSPVASITAVQPASPMAPALAVGQGIPLAAPAPVLPAAAPVAADPLAEAPAAVWYVRPPSGGQYGPARGDVMRKWIAEGRVGGDSLVWREGWTDWRSAGQLFPALGSPTAVAISPAAAAPATAGPVIAVPAAAPSTPRSTARYAARKKSGNGMAIAALVGLVLVCVVLVGVLVVVLAQQSA